MSACLVLVRVFRLMHSSGCQATTLLRSSLDVAKEPLWTKSRGNSRGFPRRWSDTIAVGQSLTESLSRHYAIDSTEMRLRFLRLLFIAVTLLFVIACANIANLSLARTLERRRELAVRGALGASRGALVSSVLAENLLLTLVGGSVGFLVAFVTTGLLLRISPDEIAHVFSRGGNLASVLYTGGVSVFAAMVISIAPILIAIRNDLRAGLSQGASGGLRGGLANRARSVLVVAQLAVALLLLAGSGLLVRSMMRIATVDVGFEPTGVVIARLSLPFPEPGDRSERRLEMLNQFVSEAQSHPGRSFGWLRSCPGHCGAGPDAERRL